MSTPPPTRRIFPGQLHEEAFGLYCAGLSGPQVVRVLKDRYGRGAPTASTLKRWMRKDRWTARRREIVHTAQALADRVRARLDADKATAPVVSDSRKEFTRQVGLAMTRELQRLRETFGDQQ